MGTNATGEYVDLADLVRRRLSIHGPLQPWVLDQIDKVFEDVRRTLLLGGAIAIGGVGELTSKEFPRRKVAGNLPHLNGRSYTIPERRKLVVEPEWSFDRDLREELSPSEAVERCRRKRPRSDIVSRSAATNVQ